MPAPTGGYWCHGRAIEGEKNPGLDVGMMRVLIADDDRHAREGLSALLRTYQGVEVIREVEDGRAAIEMAESVRPDVVMLELGIAPDGIEVTRVIKGRLPDVTVIILTMESVQLDVALAAGADAFVSKGTPPRDLVETLFDVHNRKLATKHLPRDEVLTDQVLPEGHGAPLVEVHS